jgi:hypothetical protein
MLRRCIALIAVLALVPPTVSARAGGSVAARVRITAAGKQTSGRLTAVDAETVTLLPDGKADPIRIPRSSISSVEVSDGKRSRARADLAGVGVGFLTGIGVCLVARVADTPNPGPLNLVPAFICAAGGLGVGVVSGIVAAHLIGRERWRPVPLSSLSSLFGDE